MLSLVSEMSEDSPEVKIRILEVEFRSAMKKLCNDVDAIKEESRESFKEVKEEIKNARISGEKTRVELADLKARINIMYAFLTAIIIALIGIALKVMSGGI